MMADIRALQGLRVSDLFELCPTTIRVFMRHRMACVGCEISIFETVGEAIANYDLDNESFLKELELVIRRSELVSTLPSQVICEEEL
jgi:hybrid cluster-associated redox disulfide protein